MAKINFTASRIDAHTCKPPAAQAFIWDSASPGLGLRVTSAGAKAYVYQGKINGRTARISTAEEHELQSDNVTAGHGFELSVSDVLRECRDEVGPPDDEDEVTIRSDLLPLLARPFGEWDKAS